jgi:hypothetical protein
MYCDQLMEFLFWDLDIGAHGRLHRCTEMYRVQETKNMYDVTSIKSYL